MYELVRARPPQRPTSRPASASPSTPAAMRRTASRAARPGRRGQPPAGRVRVAARPPAASPSSAEPRRRPGRHRPRRLRPRGPRRRRAGASQRRTPVDWADAGPVAAQEEWDHYRHDSGVSVTWGWHEAPRQQVTSDVLTRLLSPGTVPQARHACCTGRCRPAPPRVSSRARSTRPPSATPTAGRRSATRPPATPPTGEQAQRAAHEEAAGAGVVLISMYVTVTAADHGRPRRGGRRHRVARRPVQGPGPPPVRRPGRRVRHHAAAGRVPGAPAPGAAGCTASARGRSAGVPGHDRPGLRPVPVHRRIRLSDGGRAVRPAHDLGRGGLPRPVRLDGRRTHHQPRRLLPRPARHRQELGRQADLPRLHGVRRRPAVPRRRQARLHLGRPVRRRPGHPDRARARPHQPARRRPARRCTPAPVRSAAPSGCVPRSAVDV